MRWRVCAALAVAFAMTSQAQAIDLRQLAQETQRISGANGEITMAWWIPQAFWDAGLSSSKDVSPASKAQMLDVLKSYMVFALAHGKVASGGLTDVSSTDDLIRNAKLEIGGHAVEPLSPESLPGALATILGGFKPGLARSMGPIGQSMQFVVYPSVRNGKRLIDLNAAGGFQYILYGKTYFWHLPLSSLRAPKVDRRTHEQFPGNFQFNPYTGERLGSGP